MHPVRPPEIRQISNTTFVFKKPGVNTRIYLDSSDLEAMQQQISALKKKD